MSIARIRKNDIVIVNHGNDAGRTGKVLVVNAKEGTAIVEGLNLKKKSVRRTERTQGGIIEKEFPIPLCKLMPYDEAAKKGSRVKAGEKDGKKALVLKSSGKAVDFTWTKGKGA